MWLTPIILILILLFLWIIRRQIVHVIFLTFILAFAISSFIVFITPFQIGPEIGSYIIYTTSDGCMNKPSITNPFGLWKYNHQTKSIDGMGISELVRCGYANMSSRPAPSQFYILFDLFIITSLLYLIYIFYKILTHTKEWLQQKRKSDPDFFKFRLK